MRRPTWRSWARIGAAIGAAAFCGLLVLHVLAHGGIHAELGCVIGPEQGAINLPATIVDALAPNPWVYPQRFGEPSPVGYAGPDTSRWSPFAWVATGWLAYVLAGTALGAMLGAARMRLRAAS